MDGRPKVSEKIVQSISKILGEIIEDNVKESKKCISSLFNQS